MSLSSVKRWCKRYDGTWQSLKERSHRPKRHPRQHTAQEEELIREALDKMNLLPTIRGEELTLEQFAALADILL